VASGEKNDFDIRRSMALKDRRESSLAVDFIIQKGSVWSRPNPKCYCSASIWNKIVENLIISKLIQ